MTDKDFNNQIDRMVRVIVKEYQLEKIILFGSEAGAGVAEEYRSKSIGTAV